MRREPAWIAGAVLQGVILGTGLLIALLWLADVFGAKLVFRYQGF